MIVRAHQYYLCLLLVLGLAWSPLSQGLAQDPDALDDQFITLSGYLDQGDYEQGLVLLDTILDGFARDARDTRGPVFGRFYYLKGLFQMAQGRYEDAAHSFSVCHEVFSNKTLRSGEAPNEFTDEALIRQVSCLIALERFDEAVPLFGEVDRSGLGSIGDHWAWLVNRGVVMIQTGREEEGIESLQDTLENDNPNITSSMRMEVIRLLARHWSGKAGIEETAAFVGRSRPIVEDAESADRGEANLFFIDAAREAFDQEDFGRSLLWLSLFDYQSALAAAATGAEGESAEPSDAGDLLSSYLALTAAIHSNLNSAPGAAAAYDALLERFPGHDQAANFRFNLALSQLNMGLIDRALESADALQADFPQHRLASEIDGVVVEALLISRQWEQAVEVADRILDRDTEESVAETAMYVRGVALLQLDRVEQAEAALDAYAARFETGAHHGPALYYLAAAKYQNTRMDAAARTLEDFMQAHAESPFASAALLLQARALVEAERVDEALQRLRRIAENYPDSEEATEAGLLEGQLLAQSDAPAGRVRRAYESAREAAMQSGDSRAASESLKRLLLLAVDSGDSARVSEYYDAYFSGGEYDDAEAAEIIVAAWEPLSELGRREELVERMEALLFKYGAERGSEQLADLVEAYRDLMRRSPSGRSRLVELSSMPDTPDPLRAWLYIARIESLPDESSEADRSLLFEALAKNIPREAMSSYALTRLSEWYAQEGDPQQAAELRDYLLESRRGEAGFEHVLLAVAQQEAQSDIREVRIRARSRFQEVLDRSENDELMEQAQLGIARIHTKLEDWSRAEEAWGGYLSERDWVSARAEANFEYARSIEEGGDMRKALGYYVSIYANFAGQLDWSTQAYLRAARIMDAQGKRKEALLILQDMLRRLHTHDHPGVEEAKKLFKQWRDEFVQSQ
ncbi:MAG: tetratricopeptide repeat protein [Opitutales bacterium]